jgi:hypothetical protein
MRCGHLEKMHALGEKVAAFQMVADFHSAVETSSGRGGCEVDSLAASLVEVLACDSGGLQRDLGIKKRCNLRSCELA